MIDLDLVEQILSKADATRSRTETAPSLKAVMDIYKALKLSSCRETKVYKLLLKICMNKQVPWMELVQRKRQGQIKWTKAIEHYKQTVLYRYLYYWMNMIKENIEEGQLPTKDRLYKTQCKENLKNEINQKSPANLNKSYALSKAKKKIRTNKKHTNREMKLDAKYRRVLMLKGLKSLVLFAYTERIERQNKNCLIENCIMAIEYCDRKQYIKAFIGLKKFSKLYKAERCVREVVLCDSNKNALAKSFTFWLKRFSTSTYKICR